VRRSEVIDTALARRGEGQLLMRGFSFSDSSKLDRPFLAVARPTPSADWLGGGSDSASVSVTAREGTYNLRVTCMGCSVLDTTLTVRAGRHDTLDAYLTRFPDNCEMGPP
jgi:hypothetical protein